MYFMPMIFLYMYVKNLYLYLLLLLLFHWKKIIFGDFKINKFKQTLSIVNYINNINIFHNPI